MVKRGIKSKLVVVIDNGIEDDAFENIEAKASPEIKERVKSFGKYIIQVGRVYPIKNYETVIRALGLLPGKLKFVIVGPVASDSYKKKLEELAKSLKLGKRVVFAGVIRGSDKYYIMRKAQMMVHMAIWESFCNVVHEGLSQGLICVVADNTALPYLIKDGINGYCVETHDYKKVAEKIEFVMKNKKTELIKEMEETCRAFGLRNSWSEVALNMHRLYKSLANGSGGKGGIQKYSRISAYYNG